HMGKASIMQRDPRPIVFDSHVMRLRFDRSIILPEFFAEWMRTIGGRALFMRQAGRTAVQYNVNAKQIARVEIPLPPPETQRDFCTVKDDIREQQKRLEDATSESDILFASLLQRAFQGEL